MGVHVSCTPLSAATPTSLPIRTTTALLCVASHDSPGLGSGPSGCETAVGDGQANMARLACRQQPQAAKDTGQAETCCLGGAQPLRGPSGCHAQLGSLAFTMGTWAPGTYYGHLAAWHVLWALGSLTRSMGT